LTPISREVFLWYCAPLVKKTTPKLNPILHPILEVAFLNLFFDYTFKNAPEHVKKFFNEPYNHF
jgi:hypothetical protein